MPDVFEKYFASFGKKVSDYYSLMRLDPSYRIIWPEDYTDIPADIGQLKKLFNSWEPGAGEKLDGFLSEASIKYRIGLQKLVYKPGLSLSEFADAEMIKGIFKLDVFTSMKNHIGKYFKHPRIRQIMEFPVLFLGALPENTPALYSLMNYADIKGGTWYPQGGMYSVVQGMYTLAKELGVYFHFNEEVTGFEIDNKCISHVITEQKKYTADVVIAGADYHHIEQSLLPRSVRSYSASYWRKRQLAPSCLLYYVGLNKKIKNIRHHNLFFDTDFQRHGKEIYKTKTWPAEPLFYVCVNSVTDNKVAPPQHENLFFLVPVAAGLTGDDEVLREKYFNKILSRFEQHIGEKIQQNIIYKRSFANSDFVNEYNSFKGNAYGLANTLMQTAILKPKCKSNKLKNLYYTGQLTVPGPGVPPSLISGEVVAGIACSYKTEIP
jgi:phytoene desaturase